MLSIRKRCPPTGRAYHFRAAGHGSDVEWVGGGGGGEGFINSFSGLDENFEIFRLGRVLGCQEAFLIAKKTETL